MNEVLHIIPRLKRLVELETAYARLEKDCAESVPLMAEINAIRASLPTAILNHHYSRTLRGKKSLAPVIGGICGACHLAIPSGRMAELRKIHNDLNVCNHCDVFIYLPDGASSPAEQGKPATKNLTRLTARGPRKAVSKAPIDG